LKKEWPMRAVTIQLPDDLDEALESYQAAEQDAGDAAAVAERALREFLAARGHGCRKEAAPPSPDTQPEAATGNLADPDDIVPRETLTEQEQLRRLLERGYKPPKEPLAFTPAEVGSEDPYGSVDHDRILAEKWRQ
jgi:hypothetical protein